MINVNVLSLRAVIVILTVNSCNGQILQLGFCRNFDIVRNFNKLNFFGRWYEIERYPTWYERHGHCASKVLTQSEDGVELEHTFVRDGIEYVLHLNASMGEQATIVTSGSNIDPVAIPLSVVATDYHNYAVVYGCKQNDELAFKYVSAFILSRRRTLTEQILETARSVINNLPHSSTVFLETVSQSNDDCGRYWTAHVQAEYSDGF